MRYRNICFEIYWKLQSKIAPGLEYSQTIYERVLNECVKTDCSWLDLGCGHKLLPSWRYEKECQLLGRAKSIVGLDYDFHSLKNHKTILKRVRGDIGHLPFENDCFDFVTCNMVFEHLRCPAIQIKEIYRIIKPGGILLIHTPNTLSYGTIISKVIPKTIKEKLVRFLEGRREKDIFLAYYKINSSRKIQEHSKLAGFKITQIKMINSSAQILMIPPLVVFELILIRILMTDRMKAFRSNIIAKLEKPLLSRVG